ncbi:thioesterase-like superfamily protein [Mycobacterium xenopi 4042]|uniref:Thioesterase-like superfamily protein n=1 Tax=Mycobacterium xenopi 4042 TaxID=1299334 RepID=X8DK47_MYCXE|nr:thioesterase-like superfamily protein [Mycobacterium xenopi 4042]
MSLFTTAMQLREVAATSTNGRVFEGELNKHWTIGPKVHGGAMLALCANAARTAHGGSAQPVAVSGSFLWAPDPGRCGWPPRSASAAAGSALSTSNSAKANAPPYTRSSPSASPSTWHRRCCRRIRCWT